MPTTLRAIGHSALSQSAKAIFIPHKNIASFWDKAAPWIKNAMERGDMGTFATVQADVFSGHASLWLVWDEPVVLGAAVTQIIEQDNRLICMIVACGGEDAGSWVHLIAEIEKYAKAHECELMRIVGRKGWMRVLPDYKESRVILEKAL